MNGPTLKALKLSIAHWRRLATGQERRDEIPDARHCALCALFNKPTGPNRVHCVGCPVRDKTGKEFCKGSPYLDANRAWVRRHQYPMDARIEALREYFFLRSLLPTKNPSHAEAER